MGSAAQLVEVLARGAKAIAWRHALCSKMRLRAVLGLQRLRLWKTLHPAGHLQRPIDKNSDGRLYCFCRITVFLDALIPNEGIY